jgi:hypothetical protein
MASSGYRFKDYPNLVDASLWAESQTSALSRIVAVLNDPNGRVFPPILRVSGLFSAPVTRLCILAAGGHLSCPGDGSTQAIVDLYNEEVESISRACNEDKWRVAETLLSVFGIAGQSARVHLDTLLKQNVAREVIWLAGDSSIFDIAPPFLVRPHWDRLAALQYAAGPDPGPGPADVRLTSADDLGGPFDPDCVLRVRVTDDVVTAHELCRVFEQHPRTFVTVDVTSNSDLMYLFDV